MPRDSGFWRGIVAPCVVLFTAAAFAQSRTAKAPQEVAMENGTHEFVPSRVVDFESVETDPSFALPAITNDYPHCLSDGSLVLRSTDWDAVKNTPKGKIPKYNEIVTVVRAKKTQTILSAGISDLTDVLLVADTFPTDAGVYFLLEGTKEQPGQPGPGKSPSGIPLKDYSTYVARFDLDGTYKGATELGVECDVTRPGYCEIRHLAVFPSGDMLVTESDPATSTLKVLYLKSSGEVVKQIDVPAGRRPINWGEASSKPDIERSAKAFLSSVFFTAVGSNIVVWRANVNDPVVEVRQGGGVREVPLQIPDGWRFADMVAANDRWVVHLRTENTPPLAPMSENTDSYYEMRPQDGSLSAKIAEKGDVPLSIACESGGAYTSYKMNKAGKMVLLKGQ